MRDEQQAKEPRDEAELSEAFGELYDEFVDRIYSYIYHRVGNVRDTEDLTSRTFFRAYAHFAEYEDRGLPISAWLYRIAHNLVANHHRDRSRRPVVALDNLVLRGRSDENPETVTVRSDLGDELREAVATLDRVRQELLVLKHEQGLSNAEIGAVLGRSEGAIKSLYHRTLLALRKELSKRGIDIE
jgi:RNA polymerase sigma-70 factor, ECF subfamily